MVNQKDGFDCPGCAWPDPDHRSPFEFCENGAKAVADEAMKANVNRKFFAKYTVKELSLLIDGSGGGQTFYATGGGTNLKGISSVISRSSEIVSRM